jgi:hypothetical protein
VKSLILVVLISVAGCTAKRPAESSREVTGTQSERIAAVSAFIAKHTTLPTVLADASFLEEQVGDGSLGPPDFSAFYVLSVAPSDIPVWRAALSPLEPQNTPARYAAPKKGAPWWLQASEFGSLELYSPKLLTGRGNGWIGIHPQTGKIFVYAFTM